MTSDCDHAYWKFKLSIQFKCIQIERKVVFIGKMIFHNMVSITDFFKIQIIALQTF